MANFFDQFDGPASGPTAQPNYFDQFDTPAAPAAAPPVAQPEGANPWLDTASSFASGVLRGGVETAMLPVTAGRLIQSGGNWVHDRGEDALRSALGMDPISPEEAQTRDNLRNDNPINNAIFGAQDAVRGGMDAVLHDPQTTPGHYAETIGEFVAPGGLPSEAVRAAPTVARKAAEYTEDVIRNAVLPGAISEAAGQATEGTPFEAPARVGGAILGGGTGAMYKAANAPESVLRRAVGDPNAVPWDRARALQNNGTGVALTGPEAIAQAQGGASALPDVMRVVEGSIDGGSVMAPFFAQRPGQVSDAVGGTLDTIAPQSAQPSSLGPRVSAAADGALDAARQDINDSTRPLYQSAEGQVIPDAEFAGIAADPRFQAALARLRGNAELAPDYAGMPDNSIAVVDAVTKDMFSRGEALSNSANPLYGPELGARNTTAAGNARDVATNASSDYAQALAEQAAARQDVLAPLENGPLGNAAAANTTQSAGEAILPRNPLVGSQDETTQAVIRLMGQDADATKGLVRQNLSDRFNAASTDTQQGANQFVGARFAKEVSGNPQRDATLMAVLDAIGATDAQKQFPELLDVLQATGRRKPIGSATEFNRTINADLGNASPFARSIDLVKSLGASFVTNAGDATKRVAQRNSTRALAQMFTDPDAVDLIRMALAKGADTNFPEALTRLSAQTAPMSYERRTSNDEDPVLAAIFAK